MKLFRYLQRYSCMEQRMWLNWLAPVLGGALERLTRPPPSYDIFKILGIMHSAMLNSGCKLFCCKVYSVQESQADTDFLLSKSSAEMHFTLLSYLNLIWSLAMGNWIRKSSFSASQPMGKLIYHTPRSNRLTGLLCGCNGSSGSVLIKQLTEPQLLASQPSEQKIT